MAVRIAWFKLYYPLEYYATYFTWRSDAYDIETMVSGLGAIKSSFIAIGDKIKNNIKLTTKENGLYPFLEVAIEMFQRGYKFLNIDLEKSDANEFVVDYENKALIPPFKILDGIGTNAANSVIEARKNGPFLSKNDLKKRTKLNDTNLKLLEKIGVLKDLNESDQLTLFNF